MHDLVDNSRVNLNKTGTIGFDITQGTSRSYLSPKVKRNAPALNQQMSYGSATHQEEEEEDNPRSGKKQFVKKPDQMHEIMSHTSFY